MGFRAIIGAFAILSVLSPVFSENCKAAINYRYTGKVGQIGILTTLNWPSKYPSTSTPCQWQISTDYDGRVKIKFTTFYTIGSGSCSGPEDDYLEIVDSRFSSGDKRIGKFCGSSLPPVIISSGIYLYFNFTTKSDQKQGKGFRIEYSRVEEEYGCGLQLLTASIWEETRLTSPNYPAINPSTVSCQWTIKASRDSVVRIHFTNFSTKGSTEGNSYEDCLSTTSDKLEIYDSVVQGSRKLLGKFCGNALPPKVISRGKDLLLKLSGRSLVSKPVFRLEYKDVVKPAQNYSFCSPSNSDSTNNNIKLKASSSSQYIQSPYYPNKYPSNIQCTWVISASSSKKRVQLTIINVNMHNYVTSPCSSSSDDCVTIRDGSSLFSNQLRQLCDKNYPSLTVTSSGPKMWIQFKTNSDNYFSFETKEAGFKMKFIEVEESSNDVGMIVGIVVGVIILIVLIAFLACFIKRKKSKGHAQRNAAATSDTGIL